MQVEKRCPDIVSIDGWHYTPAAASAEQDTMASTGLVDKFQTQCCRPAGDFGVPERLGNGTDH